MYDVIIWSAIGVGVVVIARIVKLIIDSIKHRRQRRLKGALPPCGACLANTECRCIFCGRALDKYPPPYC